MGKEAFDISTFKAPEQPKKPELKVVKEEKPKVQSTREDFDLVKGSADEQKTQMMDKMFAQLPADKQEEAKELLLGKLTGTENKVSYQHALNEVLTYYKKYGETVDQQEDRAINETIEGAEKKEDQKIMKKGRFKELMGKIFGNR